MVVGDWGRDGAFHQRQVAAAMGEFRQSRLVVSTGDNFYQHGVGSIDDRKWDTSFQRIYTDVPQRWYAVLGNHDYGGKRRGADRQDLSRSPLADAGLLV